jgi:hypothetical protein
MLIILDRLFGIATWSEAGCGPRPRTVSVSLRKPPSPFPGKVLLSPGLYPNRLLPKEQDLYGIGVGHAANFSKLVHDTLVPDHIARLGLARRKCLNVRLRASVQVSGKTTTSQ